MATCEHSSQKYKEGEWLCAACNEAIQRGVFDRDKILSVRLNGVEAMKQMRDLGMTEREMTKRNLEMYKENNPGKDPVRVDGKDRWI